MTIPEQNTDIDDHRLDILDLYQRYNSDPKTGLTDDKVEEIFKRDGPNILSEAKTKPLWMKLLKELFSGFSSLFWICAILCLIEYTFINQTYEENPSKNYLWLGIGLIIFIISTSCFSLYQQLTSLQIINSMKNTYPKEITVIRNGEKKKINIKYLVIGDIIEINSGDQIPADIRIVESNNLKVNNSSLTGESEPQTRSTEFTQENPLETKNLAFLSTFVAEGTGKGLVIRTGDHTVMGRINNLASIRSTADRRMTKEMNQSISIITGVSLIVGISLFIIALVLDYSLIESSILLIVVIIVIAPKSLSIGLTICLTLISKRMSKQNCLVENLESIGTLGSTSIICLEKTGVLTSNQITVSHLWLGNRMVQADLIDESDMSSANFRALTRCAMLCNRAYLKQDSDQSGMDDQYHGDSSEVALLKYVQSTIGHVNQYRELYEKVCEIPHNATNQYQLSIYQIPNSNSDQEIYPSHLLLMKGNPQRIFSRCSSMYIDGVDTEIDDYCRNQFDSGCSQLQKLGERIFAFCDIRFYSEEFPHGFSFDIDEINFPTDNLRFLGMIGMIDPPQASVPPTIRNCQLAGIKVIMLTADHPVTAKVIARAVGIISERSETVEDVAERLDISPESVNLRDVKASLIHGNDLREKSSSEINTLIKDFKEIVFARMLPSQKSLIIQECQQQGFIVTMIGNSVTDSSALKQADVGIVMGLNSSDISKQAADIIIMDDNFSSIITGVKEGRLMFDNLQKSISYTMTSNIPKIILVLICLLTNLPLIWSILPIFSIDLINLIGSISLLYNKAETNIMKRSPKDTKNNPLVNKRLLLTNYILLGIIQVILGFIAYFLVINENGSFPSSFFNLSKIDEQDKQLKYTSYVLFFLTILICQWITLIIIKTRGNSILEQPTNDIISDFGIIFETILVGIISYVFYSDGILNISPFKFQWYLPSLSYVFIILILNQIRKYIIQKQANDLIEPKNSS